MAREFRRDGLLRDGDIFADVEIPRTDPHGPRMPIQHSAIFASQVSYDRETAREIIDNHFLESDLQYLTSRLKDYPVTQDVFDEKAAGFTIKRPKNTIRRRRIGGWRDQAKTYDWVRIALDLADRRRENIRLFLTKQADLSRINHIDTSYESLDRYRIEHANEQHAVEQHLRNSGAKIAPGYNYRNPMVGAIIERSRDKNPQYTGILAVILDLMNTEFSGAGWVRRLRESGTENERLYWAKKIFDSILQGSARQITDSPNLDHSIRQFIGYGHGEAIAREWARLGFPANRVNYGWRQTNLAETLSVSLSHIDLKTPRLQELGIYARRVAGECMTVEDYELKSPSTALTKLIETRFRQIREISDEQELKPTELILLELATIRIANAQLAYRLRDICEMVFMIAASAS